MTHSTRSLGLAELSLEDGRGRMLAHGTARCVIIEVEPRSGGARGHVPADPPANEGLDPYLRPLEGKVPGPERWDAVSGIERLREVQREVYPSPMMRLTGARIVDVADGDVTCGMPASGWLMNYGGTIYGGAIGLLAEATASAAVLSTLPPATACSPLDLKLNFIRPVKPSPNEITARGRVVHRGRTIAIVHCELSTEGKLVAIAKPVRPCPAGAIVGQARARSRRSPLGRGDHVICDQAAQHSRCRNQATQLGLGGAG